MGVRAYQALHDMHTTIFPLAFYTHVKIDICRNIQYYMILYYACKSTTNQTRNETYLRQKSKKLVFLIFLSKQINHETKIK